MMYAIYRLSDGVVVKHVTCPRQHLDRNTPAGCAAHEGEVDALRHRIDPESKRVIVRTDVEPDDWQWRAEQELARETIANIERGQARTIREALLGDPEALERLREQQPAIDAARSVLRRPRPTAEPSAPSPAEPAPPLPE